MQPGNPTIQPYVGLRKVLGVGFMALGFRGLGFRV